MRVTKEAGAGLEETAVDIKQEDLDRIHALSRKKLTPNELYLFSVRLCDNEIDREGERFTTQTLTELAPLYIGKSGIFDHQWTAKGQTMRIYHTEVVRDNTMTTQAGDSYCYLKGYAYMLRTQGNEELIAEIEGGIKKEVSVGCAVQKSICSICNQESKVCPHVKGQRYDGKLCWVDLLHATDAYEWSFVAVPAQKHAGIIKAMKKEKLDMSLKEFLQEKPELLAQLQRLEQDAMEGKKYLDRLRAEVSRLGMLAEPAMPPDTLEKILKPLAQEELCQLKALYQNRLNQKFPAQPQLSYHSAKQSQDNKDRAFLI